MVNGDEEQLRHCERILAAVSDYLSFVDRGYVFRAVNDAYLSGFLKRREDIVGHSVGEVLGRQAFEEIVKPKLDSCLAGEEVRYQHWLDLPSRGRRYLDVSHYPLIDAAGSVEGVVAHVRDITDQKRLGDDLRASEANYRTIFNAANDAIFVQDPATTEILDVNSRVQTMFGYPPEVARRLTIEDLSAGDPAETRKTVVHWNRKTLTEGPQVLEWLATDRHGSPFWVEVSLQAVKLGGQERVLAVVRDIDDRKRAEEALRKSEDRYREVVEAQTEFIVRWAPGGRLTFLNDAYCRYFGKGQAELLGASFLLPVAEEDRTAVEEKVRRLTPAHPAETDEHRVIRPDGSIGWQEWTHRAIFDDRGTLIELQSVGRDVTERRRSEEDRRRLLEERTRQARLLETIQESTTNILAYLDEDLRFVAANSAFLETLGKSREELVGTPFTDLRPEGDEVTTIVQHVLATGHPAKFREVPLALTGRPELGLRYMDASVTAVKNEEGDVEGIVISAADVTEQVRSREQALAAERARREIAESLAQEVTHRVQNSLAMIAGLLRVQLSDLEPGSSAARIVASTMARICSIATVQQQLEAPTGEELTLCEAIQRVTRATCEAVSSGSADVEVVCTAEHVRYPPTVTTAVCVMVNELVMNALKYGAPGESGKLKIQLTCSRRPGRLAIAVWNSGNPIAADFDAAAQPTTGLRLVHDIAVGQYEGSFALQPREGGTLAEIVVDDQNLGLGNRNMDGRAEK